MEKPLASQGDPLAVRKVVVHSTRHVLATSMTTVAGFMPLILGGGGFWPPLATAISGGVIGATLLALVLIPAGFLLAMCPATRLAHAAATVNRTSCRETGIADVELAQAPA